MPLNPAAVKRYRLIRELTQAELSRLCGHEAKWLNRIERGRITDILHDDMLRLAASLGVNPHQLRRE